MKQEAAGEALEVYSTIAPRAAGGRHWLLALALLLAALALGAAAVVWYSGQRLESRLDGVGARVAAQEAAAAAAPDVRAGMAAMSASIESAAARVATLETAQHELRDALAAQDAVRADLALAEAEYLQRLAAQSLLLSRDVRGAIALLEASDAILQQREDPALHPARAQLAQDLGALRQVAAFDVEGTYLRLAALAAAIPTLGFPARVPQAEVDAAPVGGAAGLWQRMLALLERFIVIRRDAPPAVPMLPLADEQLLRMNIRLALEQAKLALLAGESVVYASALAEAGSLLREHLGAQTPENRSFLDELQRLEAERVAPELPDISASLRVLRERARAGTDGV